MMTIVLFVVIEVIPMLIVLDWSFMEIFVISGEGRSTFHLGVGLSASDISSLRSFDF